MIYDAIWSNHRKEYVQSSKNRWSWVDKVDVTIDSLSFISTITLPKGATADNITSTLMASTEIKELVKQAVSKPSSTSFKLTVSDEVAV